MHVEPKHLASGAAVVILLIGFLFWQGAADGRDQEVPQTEQEASAAGGAAWTAKSQAAARYEKIRGMESQTAIEDLRNPFSPAHEKRGEAVAVPEKPVKQVGRGPSKGNAESPSGALPQANPQPLGAGNDAGAALPPAAQEVDGPKTILTLRGIVQGAEPLVILSDGRMSRSLAVGEQFLAYEVVEIGRTGVRLRGPDGEIWLTMASFS